MFVWTLEPPIDDFGGRGPSPTFRQKRFLFMTLIKKTFGYPQRFKTYVVNRVDFKM